jgi:hypothetical protein
MPQRCHVSIDELESYLALGWRAVHAGPGGERVEGVAVVLSWDGEGAGPVPAARVTSPESPVKVVRRGGRRAGAGDDAPGGEE